jgi:cytochrome c-type biogenesis protein CcmH/NrfG
MTQMVGAGKPGRSVRIQLIIAFMCLALLVYLVLLGRAAVLMIGSGRTVAIVLGGALLILPAIGLWAMVATLRAGFAHQKLARLAAEDGMELDVSALPRRPSGRIERDAADALFDTVRAELDSDPDDWRRWYRLARAYDYAGDRSRAREAMKKALELHRALQGRE